MTRGGWATHVEARRTGAAIMLLGALTLGATACSRPLPEPDSPAAQLYKARCDTCHRAFAPSTLKYEMWKFQVDRMQGEMVRHGLPPLTAEERTTLLDYLKRHSDSK